MSSTADVEAASFLGVICTLSWTVITWLLNCQDENRNLTGLTVATKTEILTGLTVKTKDKKLDIDMYGCYG